MSCFVETLGALRCAAAVSQSNTTDANNDHIVVDDFIFLLRCFIPGASALASLRPHRPQRPPLRTSVGKISLLSKRACSWPSSSVAAVHTEDFTMNLGEAADARAEETSLVVY